VSVRNAQHVGAVEPIVVPSTGEVIGIELLAVGAKNWKQPHWRRWYERLPEIVAGIRRAENLSDSQFVAINVDSEQIVDRHIADSLSGLTGNVVIEWTERLPRQRRKAESMIARAADVLAALPDATPAADVRIAFDDVGAGIDGFTRLRLMTPQLVKVDGSLFQQAREQERARNVWHHIIRFAHDISARVVTEWIENEADRQRAIAAGSDYVQGYLYGRREYRFPEAVVGGRRASTA
jgi:EAL domain-containing protein (putative c-di-GMP-specific phosphodiesterase class I)